jgi:hypothetical protein
MPFVSGSDGGVNQVNADARPYSKLQDIFDNIFL